MNAIDKLIALFDPAAGMRRAIARKHIERLQTRGYDGAKGGRRTDGWYAQGQSANSETLMALRTLRDRHRDLVRNNPWASRAVQAIVTNTVGYGISSKLQGANEKAVASWKAWSESTQCDADGRHDLAGLQSLIMRTVAESGEAIIRRRWRRPEDGLSVPMQVQVLEPDYLDHGRTESLQNGGRIVQGVEFDAIGKRVAYWLFREHPGDTMIAMTAIESVRVPASDVAHVYRVDRPGQVRGVPWGASVLISLRDLDDYEDAYLFRQKIANCSVGVITQPESPGTAAAVDLPEKFEPGRWEFVPAGSTVEFNTPPNAGDYGPYTRDVLLRVAAGYGITFQALTGDLSSVNFSSGRMGWIEMGRNIDTWRWNMLIPQGCEQIGAWFVEALASIGNRQPSASFVWTPPRRELINPAQEYKALTEAARSGWTSVPQGLRELGEDPDAVLAEIVEWNAKLDAAGVVLDSDPRQQTRTQAETTE